MPSASRDRHCYHGYTFTPADSTPRPFPTRDGTASSDRTAGPSHTADYGLVSGGICGFVRQCFIDTGIGRSCWTGYRGYGSVDGRHGNMLVGMGATCSGVTPSRHLACVACRPVTPNWVAGGVYDSLTTW
jgi:hypothetical protein